MMLATITINGLVFVPLLALFGGGIFFFLRRRKPADRPSYHSIGFDTDDWRDAVPEHWRSPQGKIKD